MEEGRGQRGKKVIREWKLVTLEGGCEFVGEFGEEGLYCVLAMRVIFLG